MQQEKRLYGLRLKYFVCRRAASRTVKNIPKAKAVKLKTPFNAGLRAVPPASLSILRRLPGINYQNETVTFETEDYWDARRNGWVALVRIARTGYDQFRVQTLLKNHDNPKQMGKEMRYSILMQWLDYESGRWKPPKK